MGFYRLNCIPKPAEAVNLWNVSNLLLQKFPASEFTATTKLTFNARFDGEELSLVVMGLDYGRIAIKRENGKLVVVSATCKQADKSTKEEYSEQIPVDSQNIFFRVNMKSNTEYSFSYSVDGVTFTAVGNAFKVREGKWIGAKIGFAALRNGVINDAGSADTDWFRIEN